MGFSSKLIDRDLGWRAFFKRAYSLAKKPHAKVGLLADDSRAGMHVTDPDTGQAKPLTIAEIGVVNEFGTEDGHIPERSFLRRAFDEQREPLAELAGKLAFHFLFGKITLEKALDVLGLHLASETKKLITQGPEIEPTNAPFTKLKKANRGKTAKYFKRPPKNFGQALAQVAALSQVRTLVDYKDMYRALGWAVVIDAQHETKHPSGG